MENWRIIASSTGTAPAVILSRVYSCVTNNSGIWIGSLDLLTSLQSLVITINYNGIANLFASQTLGHARSSQSSVVISWQWIYNSLTVSTAHVKSSFHMLSIHFTG
jgi:hypothetical protein